MTKSASARNLLFRDLFVLILTFAVIHGFNMYYDLQISIPFIILAEIVMLAFINVINRFKGKAVLWLTLLGIILVGIAALHFFVKPLSELYTVTAAWIENGINWFLSYIAQKEEPKLIQVELYYVLAMACTAIFVCVVVLFPLSYNFITRCITGFLALCGLVAMSILEIQLNKISIFCAFIIIVFAFVELCNVQFEKKRAEKKKNASLFLYPVCILIAFAALLFPAKEDPISWQRVQNMYNKLSVDTQSAVDTMKILLHIVPDDFTIGNAGEVLSGRKKTFDTTKNEVLASIDVVGGTDSNLYLRGSTSSTYTGKGWIDESEGIFSDNEPQAETFEIMYAMFRDGLMPEEDEDIFRKVKVKVEFNRLITKSLFYSPMTTNIKLTGKKDSYDASSPNLLFNKMKKIGCNYTYEYYETNWGSETLANYLRSLDGYEYDNDRQIFADLKRVKGSAYDEIYNTYGYLDKSLFDYRFARSLPERADAIDALYTALPEDLPESVYEFAKEITKDCATEYDKIVAIEKYFSENYKYSSETADLPKNRDFVDWFISEQDEGYCTHFATAATVLCRCLGIPARYVEGFMINETLDSTRGMKLTGADAHAWCEVYIEGFGWMVVEPTPGYGIGRNTEWARKKTSTSTSFIQSNDDLEQQMLKEAEEAENQEEIEAEEQLTPEQLAELAAQRKAAAKKFWTYTVIITVSVIVLAIIIFVLAAKRAKAKKYNRSSDNEKIRILMREVLLLIEINDKKMDISDTLNEFIATIDDTYDTHDLTLRKAVEIFLKVRYSSYKANRYEVLNMYRYNREVRRNILRKQNIFKRLQYSAKLYL